MLEIIETHGVVAGIAIVLLVWTLKGQGVRDKRIKKLEGLYDDVLKVQVKDAKENAVRSVEALVNNTNAMNNMADAWASCETILTTYKAA